MHIPDERIHPELRSFGRMARRFPVSYGPVMLRLAAAAMKVADAMRIWPGKSPRPKRVSIRRADGSSFSVSVFESEGGAADGAPAVLWIHGGGFALGAPLQDFMFIDRFVAEGCVVVSPMYRVSVDEPYPAAFDDCYNTLLWMQDNCTNADGSSHPIAVGGDSAGGNLCAAVCLKARDERSVSVRFQMPLYPMLDDRPTSSSRDNNAPVWNSEANESAWRMYLGELYGVEDVPIYAAPARAKNLSGLPPCCTYVGDIEPFHDETVAYVGRLRAAGVPVDFREFEGCFHGFDIVCPNSTPAREAAEFLMTSFRRWMG